MNENSSRLTVKVVVLGDSFVGKTSLINKYMGSDFSKRYQRTFGSDISFKHIEIKDSDDRTHKISFSIWDIYGDANHDELTKQFLLGTHSIVFMYDIENFQSYLKIKKWVQIAHEKLDLKKSPVILVANKIDLRSEIKDPLSTEDGLKLYRILTEEYNLNDKFFFFIETSALNGTNISKVFEIISQILIRRISE